MANEMFQKVLDSIPEYIGWKNSESVFLGCNKNFSDKFGLQDTDSIIGKTDHDIFTEKFEIEKFIKDDKKVIETDIPLSHMTEINTDHDGNVTFIDVNKTPLHDVNGKVNGILITALDITEKIKHVQELENEQFLR